MRCVYPLGTAVWVALAALVPVPALAHGGGLDSRGCHTQRSTGQYHCHRAAAPSAPALRAPASSTGFSFRNCTQARAAGYRRIPRGSYGYGRHLDRDDDGIACE